ncbi:MAG: BirA family transcriptional regulator [Frankiales bacterium]|jgi:BirA family biotin operon repressor/biotin-[acetyl-CoA-carboxylase] ligase|nr:BirA family transcriptional regulator [Frankiales bacterium]
MYGDLDRPPLRGDALTRALEPDGYRVEVLESTSSTNAVVAARARAGDAHGLVVVAEEQTHGRGRLDRSWLSPPRAGLTFSVLVRPSGPLNWVPLLAGVGVAQALRRQCEVDAVLKWPNDLLIADRKVCGMLAEAVDGAVVLGIGLNVTTRREELPVPEATSLALEGATTTDRDTVLRALLRGISDALGDDTRSSYRALCSTLGREVRLELPGGRSVAGIADAIDEDGRLVVDGTPYAAGDVVHLR